MTDEQLQQARDGEFMRYMRDWSKRYLGRVRATVHTIAMIRSEMDCLAEQLDGVRGIDYAADNVSATANDDAMANRIARYDELRAEFQEELDRNLQAQADAHRAIANVRQPWRAVLTYRYVEGLAWVDVAERVGYSTDHCKSDLHDNGLVELFPFIPHEYDEFPEAI